jgi:hypothetical protein
MSLKPSLRAVLAETHVADLAIAWLLLQALKSTFSVVWPPIADAALYLFTAIAIMDIPYHSNGLDYMERTWLVEMSVSLISAVGAGASAWMLSRWVYGMGPIRGLSMSCKRLRRSSHV